MTARELDALCQEERGQEVRFVHEPHRRYGVKLIYQVGSALVRVFCAKGTCSELLLELDLLPREPEFPGAEDLL